ncbi:MAG: hypothetical protein ONB48_17735 [candidate division KSB1 bacterium]|nr:hypothetical protein [candidate division KSB1 bacterium]MDZ7275318.1 hypothetical protein [candidate division KSB1 bacterium]MDZ7287485.1 hypothetical protein [candidate division KSB1 bacterium]MDZ7299599.1 hypothetical protein [candidate division KSB1 bacterium]MDZ7307463.1 hypothetical protein [candidate division KSB1 bacterium]
MQQVQKPGERIINFFMEVKLEIERRAISHAEVRPHGCQGPGRGTGVWHHVEKFSGDLFTPNFATGLILLARNAALRARANHPQGLVHEILQADVLKVVWFSGQISATTGGNIGGTFAGRRQRLSGCPVFFAMQVFC